MNWLMKNVEKLFFQSSEKTKLLEKAVNHKKHFSVNRCFEHSSTPTCSKILLSFCGKKQIGEKNLGGKIW